MSIKRNHNRVSEEIEKKVVESYKELQNLHKVGRIYSLEPSTVSRIVKRNKDGKDHPAWKGGIIGIWKPI